MKGPRELKNYVAKYREHIVSGHWDCLKIMKCQDTCKKWYKRQKTKRIISDGLREAE